MGRWPVGQLQKVFYKKQSFGEFIRDKTELLFLPKGEGHYSIDQICYIFLKRFKQPYDKTLSMNEDSRNNIFEMEMKLIEKENEEANKQNSQ